MVRSVLLLVLFAVAGCGSKPDEVSPIEIVIAREPSPPAGANAFGVYANLAERAMDRNDTSLDVRDTPGMRRKAIREVEPLLAELAAATSSPCHFAFVPTGPFQERPHQLGWLYLGRALTWRIEQAVEDGDMDGAIQWAIVASCFGADLTAGSFSDATLGYGIMDGARVAIAPIVTSLAPASARALENGIRRALERVAPAEVTVSHERAEMLMAINSLQHAAIEGQCEDIASKLYGASREAVRKYCSADGETRNKATRSLVTEVEAVVKQLNDRAVVSGATRGPLEPRLEGTALAIAKQFFYSGGHWLAARDLTLARTRLLYLTAHLTAFVGENGTAPESLAGIEPALRLDPYSGQSLGYLPLGRDFIVYSYGEDGKDDRGDTDSARIKPDLLVEGASL